MTWHHLKVCAKFPAAASLCMPAHKQTLTQSASEATQYPCMMPASSIRCVRFCMALQANVAQQLHAMHKPGRYSRETGAGRHHSRAHACLACNAAVARVYVHRHTLRAQRKHISLTWMAATHVSDTIICTPPTQAADSPECGSSTPPGVQLLVKLATVLGDASTLQ